ncbi:MAG: T9SS type A sorting domain-containing protein [Candidatus Zixiibacteriota bacterium]|nr:MAG: T9SS type A sorting domain-containing protein [candidate division Zixibacteria bacterium]
MKTATVMVLFMAVAVTANSAPIDYVVSSALTPGDSVVYNLDFIDPFNLPIFDAEMKSKIANTEYTTPMSEIPIPPYDIHTFEGVQVYSNPTGEIEFYGRVEADTLLITQSYKNQANQFPPPPILYADLADDSVGDTLPGSAGEWLDITGSAISYSDDRIYVRLNNAGGGWPTSQGFNFFAYAFALYNPGSSDLSGTALVYVSVPFVFTPGLYHVDLRDTSFTRIAGIDYQTTGDSLHMSCAISDLLLDPNWNQWPPESEYILTGGITISVVSLQPSLNDFTYPSAFIPKTQYLNTEQNTPPTAGVFGMDPIYNVSVEGFFEYIDEDNNLPFMYFCIFDGDEFPMETTDHSYNDGSMFDILIPWPGDGWHTYYFSFSDGAAVIETQLDSIFLTPIGVDENPVPTAFELRQNYPNPFNSGTTIEFGLAEPSQLELSIYGITGKQITELARGNFEAGTHRIIWSGSDSFGNPVSSGVYFYRIKIGNYVHNGKMLFMK